MRGGLTARILIVEDNPTNLELMVYLLQAFGHETIEARDGVEGIEAARREKPDLILMDVDLPKMDGREAVKELKHDHELASIPVVAVTALAMVGDRERIMESGFDGYMAKPIEPENFMARVGVFLGMPQPSQPRRAESQASAGEAFPKKTATVLVVDNSPENLSLATAILEPFGYQVTTAQSVPEGLARALESPPDLIVSDVHMPRQSGYDFIQAVKADQRLRHIPFIFLSSTLRKDEDPQRAAQLGASKFLSRPIDPEDLLRELEACLRKPGA